jgi:serine/threonine protein kinase/tetratricopeptide (TPR) repeat protein
MEPERLQQIEKLFHAALELETHQQADFLREACGADEPLRREVESLLAHGNETESFLQVPAMEWAARALADDEDRPSQQIESDRPKHVGPGAARWLPASIGHYRILRLLGEGGMGVVYEAEQDRPRRVVALKVIKPGLASHELLRRFEQESEALGRLQHPGIAQIHEAGTADSGFGPQPYFAMELIRGESLPQYAEAHHLNTRQRLELMAKVCEAVHHAHQRGIIHRDLKPGNILVDESGQPKILDFGVARVTDSDAQATRQTDLGELVGTLAYMSPEQVIGDPLEIDTRSDVYSLGVILFELLAGRLPYKIGGQVHAAVQTIREEDPATLSSINRTHRGDIETIAAKALEKDRGRRYASAVGMAGDIRRYLNDEPIIARPPSATYQLQKFARRHKPLVAGVVAVFVVLIAGIIASSWEAARARRAEQVAIAERNRANTEAATAKAVNDFLQNDLLAQASANNQAGPGTKADPDIKVRTALDRAAARIEGRFKAQPLVEASIRQTIGNTYRDLGLYPEAQKQLERALELRRRVLGNGHSESVNSMSDLAALYYWQGKYVQAEPLYIEALRVGRRTLGEEHPQTLGDMNALAQLYLYWGKYAEAEPLYKKVIELGPHVLGAEDPTVLHAVGELADVYRLEGKFTQAEPLYLKELKIKRRVIGEEHPDTLGSMNNLAAFYRDEGKYVEAEQLLSAVVEVTRRTMGEQHPNTLAVMNNLAGLYRDEGAYAQAEPLFLKVLETGTRVMGEEHPTTLSAMNGLALLYLYERNYSQAESLFSKVIKLQRPVLGAGHPRRLASMNDLALVYLYERRYAQAELLLRDALNLHQSTNSNTWRRYSSQNMLGGSLAAQKKYADAEPLLLSGYQGMLQRESTIPAANRFYLQQAGRWIVQLYSDWGKPEKAAEWRKKLKVGAAAAIPR